MAEFLDSLELTTRTQRVLEREGVDSPKAFLELRRERALSFEGFGRRSWTEVAELQAHLRGRTDEPWQRFQALVGHVNALMVHNPAFRAIVESDGCLTAARTGIDEADHRAARYGWDMP